VIKKWIDDNLNYRSCTIVLVGQGTAGRKWINYEIKKSWNDGKGVVGIYIHNLLDVNQNQASKGANPFEGILIDDKKLSNIVKCYDPSYFSSKYVYDHIKDNLEGWIDEAIEIRNKTEDFSIEEI